MGVRNLEQGTATQTDAVIAQTIRATLVALRIEPATFWRQLGISRTTWYNKANGGSWSADEVARAAAILGVPVADLFDGRVPHVARANLNHVTDGFVDFPPDDVPPADALGLPGSVIDFPQPRAARVLSLV